MSQARPQQLQMVWPEERLATTPAVALPDGYALRTFQPGDEAGYLRLMAAAGFEGFDEKRVAEWLNYVLPQGFFLAVHQPTDEIAATAMAARGSSPAHPRGGELSWVATLPDHARRGLGTAVCAAAVARFIQMGYRRIYLKTDDWRLPALRTYRRLGFVPFLCAADMAERWRAICQTLAWPFTPDAWPRL